MLLPEDVPVALWPSMFVTLGRGAQTQDHSHHHIHLIISFSGLMRVAYRDQEQEVAGLLTAPGLSHSIDASDLSLIMLFIDPDCSAGLQLCAQLSGGVRVFSVNERETLLHGLPVDPKSEALGEWRERTLAQLLTEPAATLKLHPTVKKVLRSLRETPSDTFPPLEQIAQRFDLSASRLRHIFVESTGTTYSAYLRWLRFQRAAGALMTGATATQAAVHGGFHDSSHLTRTFKEMYGVTPSELMAQR